jgi:hypothetical protein
MARFALSLLLLAALAPAQVRIVSVEDWPAYGTLHVRVEGRVVTARGMPLAGVGVRLFTPPFIEIPLYETRTGAKGEFAFADVSHFGELKGIVDPPAEWLPAEFDVPEVSGACQVGEIRLAPSAALRVTVETAPGQILRGDPAALKLSIRPTKAPPRPTVISYDNGVFSIDRLPAGKAKLEICYQENAYTAPLVLEAGRRNRVLVARIPSDKDKSRKLEIVEMVRPWEAPRVQTVEGTVRAADGSPIEDAAVFIESRDDPLAAFSWQDAISGPDGRYRAQVTRGWTYSYKVDGAGENHVSGTDIQLDGALPLEVAVEAPNAVLAAQSRVRWAGCLLGWRTLHPGRNWIVPIPSAGLSSVAMVADIPGYFPVFSTFKLPEPGAAPPGVQRFRFKDGPVRSLEARSGGKPLAGAAVEIEHVRDPWEMILEPPLGYATGPDGKLRLAGDVEGEYVVYVYAPGHEPGRALWRSGAPLVVDLAPRTAVLELTGLVRGQQVRVVREGGGDEASIVVDRMPASVTVAPGNYQVLAFGEPGRVSAVARATAVAGRTTSVAMAESKGAEIRVAVPDPNRIWNVEVGPVWSRGYGEGESVKTQQGTAVLHLDRAGRYRVWACQESNGVALARDLEVSEGSRVDLRIPPLTASLRAVRPSADEEEPAMLILHAATPGGWDLELQSEKPGAAGQLEFQGLPPGKYYAWKREPKLEPDELEEAVEHASAPRRRWSGIPVTLEAGRAREWKLPGLEAPGPPLKIRVTGAQGRPVREALLFVDTPVVRVWMRELGGIGGDEPLPSLMVPVRNGAAELPGAGQGRLLLRLLGGRGRFYSLVADVGRSRSLEIRLPKEEQ